MQQVLPVLGAGGAGGVGRGVGVGVAHPEHEPGLRPEQEGPVLERG